MNDVALNLKFHGRRKLNSSKKRTYKIAGIVGLIIGLFGLFGLFKSDFEINPVFMFPLAFAIGGITNIIYGFMGVEFIKESNSILINRDEIEFKNSFRKPKKIKIDDLLDLRIETAKVEFVHNNQRIETYDFSVFQRQELNDIYKELERVKTNLIK